jgi:hypothetical protein
MCDNEAEEGVAKYDAQPYTEPQFLSSAPVVHAMQRDAYCYVHHYEHDGNDAAAARPARVALVLNECQAAGAAHQCDRDVQRECVVEGHVGVSVSACVFSPRLIHRFSDGGVSLAGGNPGQEGKLFY